MKSFNQKIKKICCIGAGYVGGPTMAVIALNSPELEVHVVDINEERINKWNSKDLTKLPVYEKGLDKVLEKTRGINLFFSTNVDLAIEESQVIFISVNTPVKQSGIGAGQMSDLRYVESCTRRISEKAKGHTIVVEKSTLPVRTAETIKSILSCKNNNYKQKTFSVLSNPEFLAEGTAINDLQNPDRVLIGGEDINSISVLEEIYLNWVPKHKIIKTNLWSSELSKLASNAFLAQRISSINSISAFCEVSGADVNEVSQAIGKDHRIGSEFLKSGPGFGGSCFKKDILNLVYLCNYFGLKEVGDYWQGVININEWQQDRIYKIIVDKLFGNISGKKIAIFGFAFKAGTNDTRESPAISISRKLLSEGALLTIHDPKVKPYQIKKDLNAYNFIEDPLNMDKLIIQGSWSFSDDILTATNNVDAIVFLTEWDEYKNIDWEKISLNLRKPSWVFDTRGFLDPSVIKKYDLNFWKLGYGN